MPMTADDRRMVLEDALSHLLEPINGQYPRPWMSVSTEPWNAPVFVVGRNQRNGFAVSEVGSRDDYMDALFNRNGKSCRGLYHKLVGTASPTRVNTDNLVRKLNSYGVTNVLETNVICYSSPMSSELRLPEHAGGRKRGTEIFSMLLETIKPQALIVQGAHTARDIARLLGVRLPVRGEGADVRTVDVDAMRLWLIPSLAPPAWNMWAKRADQQLEQLSRDVADFLLQMDRSATD